MLKSREISSVELTRAVLERIEAVEDKVHAYIMVTPEWALEQAEAADRVIAAGGDYHPLTGIPLALKDIFCTEGVTTTCGSQILRNFVPPYDSTVAANLKRAGAVIMGKANMDEFAMGSSTENSGFGPCHNPWDLERVPGGSSGGSAAAVAAGEAVCAVGTDTGGSVKQPGSLCGLVGMRPTYGRVSRFGMIAFASSLDQCGPLTREIEDCGILLSAVAGYDRRDSTSIDAPVPDYLAEMQGGVQGLKLGIPKEYFIEGIEPEVERCVLDAVRLLEEQGAEVREISLPPTEYAVATYYIIAPAEASSNLARYDGVRYGYRAPGHTDLRAMYDHSRREGFGDEPKRRIMLGTYTLSAGYYDAYYLKAQQVRTLIRRDFLDALEEVDVVVTPTAPTPAFKLGEKTEDPLQMYLNDIFTIPVNLAGLPSASIPCGFVRDLPVGLQLVANALEEGLIMRVAKAYQDETDWHTRRAPL